MDRVQLLGGEDMLDKEKLLEALRKEADFYQYNSDDWGRASYEMNVALIQDIESGKFDVK